MRQGALGNGTASGTTTSGTRRLAGSGTGVVIDAAGHVLTNNHVATDCPDLRVIDTQGRSGSARRLAADAASDLFLLQTERRWTAWARFGGSERLQPGDPVVVTGFPLGNLVSPEMAVTTGSLTTLSGPRGDAEKFEFSAPVQPGNSGGPVLDDTGRVIGIATATLNGVAVAALTGAVPQNVNFAVKADVVRDFLTANQVIRDDGAGHGPMTPGAVGERARQFTVKVECWR